MSLPPGYTGVVPGVKHSFGRTFGQSTSVALAGAPPGVTAALQVGETLRARAEMSETDGLRPDHEHPPDPAEAHTPGYTGHVPLSKQPIGRTFGFSTKVAHRRQVKEKEDGLATSERQWQQTARPGDSVPVPKNDIFQPGQTDVRRLDEMDARKLQGPPPGYTGYIRGNHHHFGRSYGNLYRKSREFEAKPGGYSAWADPKNMDEHETRPLDPSAVYPSGYGGWVPEGKDDYGKTFGRLTNERIQNARHKSTTGRQHQQHQQRVVVAKTPKGSSDGAPTGEETRQFLQDPSSMSKAQRARIQEHLYGKPPTSGQVPGFTGYVPGAMNKVGMTYGESTRACEADRNKGVVLEEAYALDAQPRGEPPMGTQRTLGYTGYRPGTKFSFGRTYGVVSGSSELERWESSHRNAERNKQQALKKGRPQVFNKEQAHQVLQAPDGGKISGWSGHVPRTEHFIGSSVAETWRRAEAGFARERSGEGMMVYAEPVPESQDQATKPPGYAGFVPTAKDDFGKTFGDMSKAKWDEFHHHRSLRQKQRAPPSSRQAF